MSQQPEAQPKQIDLPPVTLAELIEQRMRALGINQVELERRSSITDTTWASWRAGTLPQVKIFWPIIATTLQVPVEQVMGLIAAGRAKAGWTAGAKAVLNTVEATKDFLAKQTPPAGSPIVVGGIELPDLAAIAPGVPHAE